MNHRISLALLAVGVLSAALAMKQPDQAGRSVLAAEQESDAPQARENAPATIQEARGRARILHETIHGALQVMHRDFFREGEKQMIPSQSLDDVFAELGRTYGVKARWLAVDTPPMNIDHKPGDTFEKNAVKALKDGKAEYEAIEKDAFRYAGRITLSSDCLKCHAPLKSNTKDRSAGLAITIPLKVGVQEPMK